MRILAVEDDDMVRKFVVQHLTLLGYDVTAAATGDEALGILKRDKGFDLLFTDVVMPGGMLGTDLAQKAVKLNRDLRVLYTSGYTDELLREQTNGGEKVRAVVHKPYRRAELAERIREALEG